MKFQQAAMSRQDIPEDQRQDFCLYVDEFQNFATDSFESILSEARKYRLNLIVANQFMTQLTDKIREALLGNCGTIVCGRIGVTDADLMVKAFTPTFTAEDLTKTPNFAAITKVMMFDMPTAPFTINLPALMGEPNEELMKTLKSYSATRFGKTRAEVEKEINERWASASKEKAENDAANVGASVPADGGMDMQSDKAPTEEKKDFLGSWPEKHKKPEKGEQPLKDEAMTVEPISEQPVEATEQPVEAVLEPKPSMTAVSSETPVKTPENAPEDQNEGIFRVR